MAHRKPDFKRLFGPTSHTILSKSQLAILIKDVFFKGLWIGMGFGIIFASSIAAIIFI